MKLVRKKPSTKFGRPPAEPPTSKVRAKVREKFFPEKKSRRAQIAALRAGKQEGA